MEHYQLIIAYDGTEYRGFQRQKKSSTIQGELESALRKIGWQGETIQAAGRTDTGVHATGQVATFFHDWVHSLSELKAALNTHLPPSIAVQSVSTVPEDFHPRYDAVNREYKYAITISDTRQPQKERYVWRINRELDWQKMRESADLFVGKHDFSQFGRALKDDGSTVREVLISQWEQVALTDHEYTICADAFLYHMVRRIVNAMVKVGEGKIDEPDIRKALNGYPPRIAPGLAPACGLTLTKVRYNDNK
jgi:tRNA pseudouridine38-40 synthase